MAENKPPRLTFYPFAYALYTEELCTYCWYCLAEVEERKRCLGCGLALFCDKNCQTLGWKDHKAECKGLRSSKSLPDVETRLLGRIVVRHKDICTGKDKKDSDFYKDRKSERAIMEIWAHTDKMRQDPHAMKKFEDVYGKLVDFYEEKFLLPKDLIFELHCRDYINRHAISDKAYLKEIGKGLYLDLCAYDHSCRPNTVYVCNGFVATLRALNNSVKITDKRNTFYSYIDLLCSQQQRKKLLKDTWYFDCQCERCTDLSEHLLSSFLCPNCPKDKRERLCMFGDQPYKDKITQIIKCPSCEKDVQQSFVVEAVNAMRFIDRVVEDREVEQMPKGTQLPFVNDLMARFENILPSVNVYMCKLIQLAIPLVEATNSKELLRLHFLAEECVRRCFPHNHPAVAFHLKNIGIFLNNLDRFGESVKYLMEAQEIFEYTLDSEHSMTQANRVLLTQALANLKSLEKDPAEPSTSEAEQVKKPIVLEAPIERERDNASPESDLDNLENLMLDVDPEQAEKDEKLRRELFGPPQPIVPPPQAAVPTPEVPVVDDEDDFDDLPELLDK